MTTGPVYISPVNYIADYRWQPTPFGLPVNKQILCNQRSFPAISQSPRLAQENTCRSVFVYLGGNTLPTLKRAETLQKYQQWLASLGDAIVSPAVPFKDTHTVQTDGTASPGSMSAMSGLSILRLPSMDAALAAAQSCPFLEINGTLEVSEMIEMRGESADSAGDTIN